MSWTKRWSETRFLLYYLNCGSCWAGRHFYLRFFQLYKPVDLLLFFSLHCCISYLLVVMPKCQKEHKGRRLLFWLTVQWNSVYHGRGGTAAGPWGDWSHGLSSQEAGTESEQEVGWDYVISRPDCPHPQWSFSSEVHLFKVLQAFTTDELETKCSKTWTFRDILHPNHRFLNTVLIVF